ncbi:MAG: SWIM zinc finger family protein, partial [Gammaproteobacteria bacterium]|nr:SWIM zinc finger family protein [Gammaproteobacteria bacterium]
EAFTEAEYGLLPASGDELRANCSCPDYANPCKHIAGSYYRVAGILDQDPFLLFQLRGMGRDRLQKLLSATPLGQALANQLREDEIAPPPPQLTLYSPTPIQPVEAAPDHRSFWQGGTLPRHERSSGPKIPALAIRREGDRPPFWHRENSFIEAMSALYLTVESKNRDSL